MKPERLLQYFGQISETPDAVPRLRRFVLDLAVRGKLVPQDPDDRPLEGLETPELPERINFDVPTNWRWACLQDLGQIKGGGTPSKARPELWGEDIPWVSPKDMKRDYIDSALLSITPKALEESSVKLIEQGSILFVVRGMILAHSFPVALTKVGLTVNQDMKALTLRIPAMGEFVLRALKGLRNEILSKVQRSSHGTCRLESSDYQSLIFPLPPLAEQHRIVAKVDELMALCDGLEAAQAKRERRRDRLVAATLHGLNNGDASTDPPARPAFQESARFYFNHLPDLTTRPEHIHELRQTILTLAVRGNLVEQLPCEGTADSAIEEIERERNKLVAAGRLVRQPRIPPVSEEQAFFTIPSAWKWVRFGNVTFCRDGERIPVSQEERQHCLKSYDYYGASGVIDKIDAFLFDKPLLLIGEDGANLVNRSTPIAFIARGKYWVNNHAHVLDGISEGLLRYLELYINATDLRPYLTGTAQPKMNQAKMNSIAVALPPMVEQSRIVAKVDELMALCDQLETRLTSTATARRQLLEATLHEALNDS